MTLVFVRDARDKKRKVNSLHSETSWVANAHFSHVMGSLREACQLLCGQRPQSKC